SPFLSLPSPYKTSAVVPDRRSYAATAEGAPRTGWLATGTGTQSGASIWLHGTRTGCPVDLDVRARARPLRATYRVAANEFSSIERTHVGVYLSMQRVRFSSPDAYEKFKVVFADTRNHLMTLPGFLHLTWWEHPDDPGWF